MLPHWSYRIERRPLPITLISGFVCSALQALPGFGGGVGRE
jgi:hypothetical protein